MSLITSEPLRIAFTDSGGSSWTGGITYLRNLSIALKKYTSDVELYRITDSNLDESDKKFYDAVLSYNASKNRINSFINKFCLRFMNYDYFLTTKIKEIPGKKLDVAFPGRYRAGNKIATLYWIPDFQFMHLPDMYSKTAIKSLSQKYLQGIKNSSLVVLSSKTAQQDYFKFTPEYENKSRVLNFVAHIPENLYEVNPLQISSKYNIPEKFIYLPNQFWKHKNHMVVFEALRILKSKKIYPFIVMTGNPVDSRNPLFFAEMMQKVSLWGLRDQIAFLGLIPHDHIYSLMRQSIFVLNPSFFEGWSTTVEEAKSVGKKVVLSDIPVHREQNPPRSEYFDPNQPQQFADLLAILWSQINPGPDYGLEDFAINAYPKRMKKFAEDFISIAKKACALTK